MFSFKNETNDFKTIKTQLLNQNQLTELILDNIKIDSDIIDIINNNPLEKLQLTSAGLSDDNDFTVCLRNHPTVKNLVLDNNEFKSVPIVFPNNVLLTYSCGNHDKMNSNIDNLFISLHNNDTLQKIVLPKNYKNTSFLSKQFFPFTSFYREILFFFV
jgi:hypothetical protein